MFNPVYHHCHPFTDFYKGLICAEPKPLFTVRNSDTFIFWKACLLVVPADLDPRTYSIGTLHFCSGCKTASPDHPEKSCIVALNDNICSRCVRFGRLCDLFISESVC